MCPQRTGAEFFVETLEQYGVKHIFGNPGTTELPVIHEISDSSLRYILGLHEDIAVGLASGYSSTRRYHYHQNTSINPLGVINLHASAGLAHGLSNLYAAQMTGSPLLVTAGIHSTDFQHEEPILYSDLEKMAEPFTKWSAEVKEISSLPTMLRRAVRVALTPPTGPVFLGLPMNVMKEQAKLTIEQLGSIPELGPGSEKARREVANLLSTANEPIFILGDQIARNGEEAVDEIVKLAENTGARVHGEVLASEVNFPTDHPQWVSYLPPQEQLMRPLLEGDLILFIGCSTQNTLIRHENHLIPKKTKTVHIGEDPWQLGKNEPANLTVIGNPGLIGAEINKLISEEIESKCLNQRIEKIREVKQFISKKLEELAQGHSQNNFMSKTELVQSIYDVAPDAYIVDESVTSKYAMLTEWPLQKEQYFSNKGGGLGFGLPASIGASLAESMRPNPRKVIGFVGDGSYLYYPNSIYTAVRYGIKCTIIIPDNANYRILKDNTLKHLDGNKNDYDFSVMNLNPKIDIATNARSYGANGHTIKQEDQLKKTLRKELKHEEPSVLDTLIHD